jgi:hypothetical protein
VEESTETLSPLLCEFDTFSVAASKFICAETVVCDNSIKTKIKRVFVTFFEFKSKKKYIIKLTFYNAVDYCIILGAKIYQSQSFKKFSRPTASIVV